MNAQQIIETLATKVMGWKKKEETVELISGELDTIFYWYIEKDGEELFAAFDIWNPLRNIADAWQVVEKLGEKGYTMHLEWKGAGREYANSAEVSFSKSIYTKGYAVGSVTEAICNAALRTIESL